MAKTREYSDVIKAVYKEIERLFKSPKDWGKEDEKIIQLFTILKEAVFEQVHNVLAPQKTAQGEKELRDILAKYVIGYTEKKKECEFHRRNLTYTRETCSVEENKGGAERIYRPIP